MPMEGYSQWFVNECARAAKAGHALLMRPEGVTDGLYLYYRPGELALLGDIERAVAGDVGYELGTPERVPENLTVQQLTRWVNERAARLPCLPPDGGKS